MKYMGSKRRIASHITPIINQIIQLSGAQKYYEPFVGGFNIAQHIVVDNIYASDSHYFLIKMYQALQDGWLPPELVTEEQYKAIKKDNFKYPEELVGYVGFSLSFGGKWFGGYRHDKAGDRSLENEVAQNWRAFKDIVSLTKNAQFLKTDFSWCLYHELVIKSGSVVYCDPPYFGTTGYSKTFNHAMFWDWVRKTSERSTVLVSEYNAPEDFVPIWEGSIPNTLDRKIIYLEGLK